MKENQWNVVENKKAKNAILIFVLLLILGGATGGILSAVIGENESVIANIFEWIGQRILDSSNYLLVSLGIFCNVTAFVIYKRQVRCFLHTEEEDTEGLYNIEKNLNIGISILSIWTILSCMLYGFTFMKYKSMVRLDEAISELMYSAFFIISLIAAIFIQRQMVNFIKKMNPEKNGDVLSVHFQKEWVESCDELERMIIYKSAYKAYTVMQFVFSFAFLVVMLAAIYYDVSVFTYFIVIALWLVFNLVYIIESMRLNYGKKERKR